MGILTAIKKFLRLILFPSLYAGGFFVTFYSIFKDAKWGLYLLIILIPQPNIWHKFFNLPLGKDFLDVLFLAVLIGIFVQQKKISGAPGTLLIFLYLTWTYISLWNSSFRFDLPLPLSGASSQLMDWKNFAQMILFYFIIQAVVEDEKQQEIFFLLMASVLLFMAIRNYRNFSGGASFSYDKRVGGPFEAVGLGSTTYGAFVAHFMVAFLGMSFFTKERKRKILYLVSFLFCLHPLFFSYSRGAYLGLFAALLFFGIIKKRSLLAVLLVVVLGWQVLLPSSVVDRISGTETENGKLESSANTRLKLWHQAGQVIAVSPLFGSGWNSFGYSIPDSEKLTVGVIKLTDPHNYYVKILCDFGAVGLLLLIILFLKAFHSGYLLYRIGNSQFQKGLGFAFMGTVIACMVTNMFGNRFSFFVMGSYFWILWGLVEKGLTMSRLRIE